MVLLLLLLLLWLLLLLLLLLYCCCALEFYTIFGNNAPAIGFFRLQLRNQLHREYPILSFSEQPTKNQRRKDV